METTVDINALRNELAREILETDDLGLLEWIWIAMNRSGLTRPRSSGHEFDAQRQKIRKERIGMTLRKN